MSQALTLARPYARAAFAIAREEAAFAEWSNALAFASQVAAHPRAASSLMHPQVSQADAVALLAIDGASESFTRFLSLVAENRRLQQLPEIAGLYEELRAEAERVVRATVTSATELPAGELDTIRAALKRRFGREVDLATAVDASLIGGAVIDAGDVVIDGSLKGKLSRLQAALAN